MRHTTRRSFASAAVLLSLVAGSLAGCSKAPATVEAPTDPTVQAATTAPAPVVNEVVSDSMKSITLSAKVWSSSNGATITLEAVPHKHSQNQDAYFVVHLNGEKVEDIPCSWNGTAFTASADLEAADGYEYECVVFEGQGEGESYGLSDVYDSLVYLQTSLAAYCNLYISDYKVENNEFCVTAGYAHVQLPQLTAGGTEVDLVSSELVFLLNGVQIDAQPITLPAGEGAGSREASLSSIRFAMPQMEDDYQLDLELKANLSDGQQLSVVGGSWYYNNGELKMSAG